MLAYLIRRLFAVVVMLMVVTLVTFGIFFLFPKMTGTDPALYFVGKQPTPPPSRASGRSWAWTTRSWSSSASSSRAWSSGRDYANGADVTHCAAPCFGYSFKTEQEVWPLLLDGCRSPSRSPPAPSCSG